MAYSESQPTVSMIAETTFGSGDLYKFVRMSTVASHVTILGTSNVTGVIGTLLSVTYTTSTGANEAVTVGLLSGKGKVYMAASTAKAGAPITASSAGAGVLASTDGKELGRIVALTTAGSASAGRIATVLFNPSYTV